MAQDTDKMGCSDNYSSLVFEEKSGQIIFERRSDQKVYPASLTKLMTIYLTFEALEAGDLSSEQMLTVSDRAEYTGTINKTSTLKLKVGDKISVKNAIRGSIIKSFNETTVMLAEAIAGSEWKFAVKMNEKAKELGMDNTNFRNASGLYDSGQFTTNYDLARLAIALKNDFPEYYHLFSMKEFNFKDTKYKTHNYFLLDYKGAEGMKTGFTNISGYNLIAVAKKDNHRIFSILTSCASHQKRDELTKFLINKAFEEVTKNKSEELKVRFVNNWIQREEDVENKIILPNVKPVRNYILKSN